MRVHSTQRVDHPRRLNDSDGRNPSHEVDQTMGAGQYRKVTCWVMRPEWSVWSGCARTMCRAQPARREASGSAAATLMISRATGSTRSAC